jgi:hypothetical protein
VSEVAADERLLDLYGFLMRELQRGVEAGCTADEMLACLSRCAGEVVALENAEIPPDLLAYIALGIRRAHGQAAEVRKANPAVWRGRLS